MRLLLITTKTPIDRAIARIQNNIAINDLIALKTGKEEENNVILLKDYTLQTLLYRLFDNFPDPSSKISVQDLLLHHNDKKIEHFDDSFLQTVTNVLKFLVAHNLVQTSVDGEMTNYYVVPSVLEKASSRINELENNNFYFSAIIQDFVKDLIIAIKQRKLTNESFSSSQILRWEAFKFGHFYPENNINAMEEVKRHISKREKYVEVNIVDLTFSTGIAIILVLEQILAERQDQRVIVKCYTLSLTHLERLKENLLFFQNEVIEQLSSKNIELIFEFLNFETYASIDLPPDFVDLIITSPELQFIPETSRGDFFAATAKLLKKDGLVFSSQVLSQNNEIPNPYSGLFFSYIDFTGFPTEEEFLELAKSNFKSIKKFDMFNWLLRKPI